MKKVYSPHTGNRRQAKERTLPCLACGNNELIRVTGRNVGERLFTAQVGDFTFRSLGNF